VGRPPPPSSSPRARRSRGPLSDDESGRVGPSPARRATLLGLGSRPAAAGSNRQSPRRKGQTTSLRIHSLVPPAPSDAEGQPLPSPPAPPVVAARRPEGESDQEEKDLDLRDLADGSMDTEAIEQLLGDPDRPGGDGRAAAAAMSPASTAVWAAVRIQARYRGRRERKMRPGNVSWELVRSAVRQSRWQRALVPQGRFYWYDVNTEQSFDQPPGEVRLNRKSNTLPTWIGEVLGEMTPVEYDEACRNVTRLQAVFRGRSARSSGTLATLVTARRKMKVFQVQSSTTFRYRRSKSGQALKRSGSKHFMLSSFDADEDAVDIDTMNGQLEFSETNGRCRREPDAPSLRAASQAKFLRLHVTQACPFAELPSHALQLDRIKTLRGTTEFLKMSWGLEMPSVIFSVTGTALPLHLRQRYRRSFAGALLDATRNTNAWVVSGGSNVGVMKLVGDSLSKFSSHEVALGIAPWGTMHGRTQMRSEAREMRRLPKCTLRVDGLRRPHVQLVRAHLDQLFTSFGPVIGISVWRTPPPSSPTARNSYETTLRKASDGSISHAEEVLADAGDAKSDWIYFTLVSFRDHAAVNHCLAQARKGPLRVPVDQDGKRQWRGINGTALTVRLVKQNGSASEAHAFVNHTVRVLEQRGSISLPYVYDGKRDTSAESTAGCCLDANHSHYIFVDDGSSGAFGREIQLRSELLDFISFRHDRVSFCHRPALFVAPFWLRLLSHWLK
jgi:hypothetical protein